MMELKVSFFSRLFSRQGATSQTSKSTVAIDPAKVARKPRRALPGNPLKGRSKERHMERHRDGNSPALGAFIDSQCGAGVQFEYAKFFDLCEVNGFDRRSVDQYRAQVLVEKRNAGRAHMLFRNRLAQNARETGKLLDLNGNEVSIDLSERPATRGPDTAASEATVDAF
jgi:hypothetical protein